MAGLLQQQPATYAYKYGALECSKVSYIPLAPWSTTLRRQDPCLQEETSCMVLSIFILFNVIVRDEIFYMKIIITEMKNSLSLSLSLSGVHRFYIIRLSFL